MSAAEAAPAAAGPTGQQLWDDAAWAAALLCVDPHGLGGSVVRASAGPVRDRWAALLRALLPAAEPLRRMPGHIADERLLGGLDLSATLARGTPVAQRGLLAEADGGLVLAPMAERMSPATAARLAAALDSGAIDFERDGISAHWRARIGLVAFDEADADDPPLAATLVDRLAFCIDLRDLSLRDIGQPLTTAVQVSRARSTLPEVSVPDATLQALCGTALQLGVASARAGVLALRVARAAAALAGRTQVNDDDARLAARLVLAPRATRLPPPPPSAEDDVDEAPEPPPQQAETPPDPSTDKPPPADAAESVQAMEDRLVEATVAALPAGLMAAQKSSLPARQAGRVGALSASPRSGRPVGSRRGEPRGGARLNLIDTLRAAAPWQRLRHAAAGPGAGAGRIHVTGDDLRIHRLQQRAGTATLFVLDASGSSALHRLAEAKGAINLLLADCYVRRDEVAVIAFRGRTAELLLPPTRSLVRAKRSLAALPGGGGTPLALGLEAALRLAHQVRRNGSTPIVVLLTDGRANIARDGEPGRARAEADALAMARQLRAARLTVLVVDTSPQPAAAAQRLAQEMAAEYRALPYAGAMALSAAVKALPRRREG